MEIKQQLKLSQQLVMTPQLQQAIRLLQLSRLELIEEIRKECDANPVLADEEFEPRPRATGDNAVDVAHQSEIDRPVAGARHDTRRPAVGADDAARARHPERRHAVRPQGRDQIDVQPGHHHLHDVQHRIVGDAPAADDNL